MDTKNNHKRTYLVAGIVFVALLVLLQVLWRGPQKNAEASAKAQQLISAYQLAGLQAPSEQQIVGTRGVDGGAVCHTDFNELVQSNLNTLLANGAAQVGARGVIIDAKLLKSEGLVLTVYCPERLPEYEAFVNKLKTADLIAQ